MNSILLEELTSPQVGAALQSGYTSVVVACGAIEQHGPHLPLLVDAAHGSSLALEVAKRLGSALVAPTIRVGCSAHHMGFSGTISLEPATFQAICLDYTRSLAQHGFRHICFVPSHGGNFAPLADVLPRLKAAAPPPAHVHAFLDLQAQLDLWRRVVEDESGLGDRVGGHADIAEASIMLALQPGLVHEASAEAGFTDPVTPTVIERLFAEGMASISPNGIIGDARGMSSAIGVRCIAETADMMSTHFGAAMAV